MCREIREGFLEDMGGGCISKGRSIRVRCGGISRRHVRSVKNRRKWPWPDWEGGFQVRRRKTAL